MNSGVDGGVRGRAIELNGEAEDVGRMAFNKDVSGFQAGDDGRRKWQKRCVGRDECCRNSNVISK